VAIFDKPLLKKKMTLREKNELYYKAAYEHMGLSLSQEGSIMLPLSIRAPSQDQPVRCFCLILCGGGGGCCCYYY